MKGKTEAPWVALLVGSLRVGAGDRLSSRDRGEVVIESGRIARSPLTLEIGHTLKGGPWFFVWSMEGLREVSYIVDVTLGFPGMAPRYEQ